MPTPSIPEDRWADDVGACVDNQDRLWLAWSHAKLDREIVRLARAEAPSHWSAPLDLFAGAPAARPALLADDAGCFVAAVTREDHHTRATLAHIDDTMSPTTIWRSDGEGDISEVALTRGHEGDVWLVATRLTPSRCEVELYHVTQDDGVTRVELNLSTGWWRRGAHIATLKEDLWMTWLEADAARPDVWSVKVARVDPKRGAARETIDLGSGEAQGAPTLGQDRAGVLVAWHEHVGDGRRWLRAVRLSDGGITPLTLPEPPSLTRETASTDQGWEMPCILDGDEDRDAILTGRSAHNFHAVSLGERGASKARISQSKPGWGGVGRRAVVCLWRGDAILARRQRDGLIAEPIALEQTFEAAEPAATGAREVSPPAAPTARHFEPSDGVPASFEQIWFGDPHQHSAHSDGTGDIEDVLSRARRRRLDFTALTDHDRFCRKAIGPVTWRLMCALADLYHSAGEFTVLHAYEFTGARPPGPGHKNIYFLDALPDSVPDHNWGELRELLADHPAVVIPHHVGFTGDDITHHDPALQPIWEICSVHGVYEQPDHDGAFPARDDFLIPDQTLRQALEAGHRFGFCGGTDNHGLIHHHGVTPRRDPGLTGLTAVFGARNTRASILEAFKRRRTYATTGARILLAVTLEDTSMGGEVCFDRPMTLRVWARGSAMIQSAVMVRCGEDIELPIERSRGGLVTAQVEIGPREDIPHDFVYVRITQEDGDMAWSSPIDLLPAP